MSIQLKVQKDPFNIDLITKEDLSIEINHAIKNLTGNKIHKKISISSTHGVGKTTLINLLKKIYKTDNTIFYPESAIYVNEMNKKKFKLNQESNIDTQKLIMEMEVKNVQNSNLYQDKLCFFDRCVLDTYIYCIYLFEHNKLTLEEFSLIEKYYNENIYKYDYIFFIESRSMKIDNNGYRSLDKKYQLDIYNIFKKVLKTLDHNKIKIIHVKENTPLTRLIRITNELKKSIL
jgi:nicotinamide riboside kinase